MKQVVIKHGEAVVEEIPSPSVQKGCLLVHVKNSCISTGTELSGVRNSGMPLWKRALKQPDNLRKVIQMFTTQGLAKTKSIIEGKLAAGTASGYSVSGIVLEVGEGVLDIKKGENVTCSGAGYANHAEIVCVPRNLVTPMPENITFEEASTVTLGAIALQGVRRATPSLGETFVVIGLGVLGQLTIQILKANGCKVIGLDLKQDKIELAIKHGADIGIATTEPNKAEQVLRITNGYGADAVIITAASSSNEILSTAFNMCRKKGRVVLVGDVGLDIKRSDIYAKELDFFVSTSYGPGRYDNNYEEEGLDYPISYVRWTENRNMEAYLDLISTKKVDLTSIISKIYTIDDAKDAYNQLKENKEVFLLVLLSYPTRQSEQIITSRVINKISTNCTKEKLSIGLVGAGGFAKGMHLPNIEKLHNICYLRAVASKTGHNALSVCKQFSGEYATTSYEELLQDKELDALIIATRHNLHAEMALNAIKAGKNVLLEKPLCTTCEEFDSIKNYFNENPNAPLLLTGFNRRFSKYAKKIKEVIKNRTNPLVINYRMNAGYISPDHWIQKAEGGGRNIGEACHIYDLFTFLVESEYKEISAVAIKPQTDYYLPSDNFIATISFKEGSIASLTYVANGSKDYPKEHMDIYFDGKVIRMSDYNRMEFFGLKEKTISTSTQEKGQFEELKEFVLAIKEGNTWPIPLWQQLQATEISLKVQEQLEG